MITLHQYWRSSCSWRVRWALAVKGVKYKSVPVNLLAGDQKAPDFLKINPAGFVPALTVNGQTYTESLAIMEWLEEKYPTPALLPQPPDERMRVRQLCMTIVAGIQPVQNLSVMKRASADPKLQQEWAQYWIARGLETYETLLRAGRPGTYSFGSQITMADICLVPQVYNARRFNVNLNAYPLLKAVAERAEKTPECVEASPEKQPGAQLLA